MSEGLISTAASQYANRPRDERFPSLEALIAHAEHDRAYSVEKTYNYKDLTATLAPVGSTQALQLTSPIGKSAAFTHYSFGQLCSALGAPAKYVRTLPPQLAADCLNYGLHDTKPGERANILIKTNGGPTPTIRACTSDSYGRVWDAQLYSQIATLFCNPDSSRSQRTGQHWSLPPTWGGATDPGGAYRGDRDSFLLIVDGGSIVTDPSVTIGGANQGDGQMFRGLMIRNSEVGHCSISIECVLFRAVCGNHNLWGAIMDRQFKRRHVGGRITVDTMRELSDLAWKFTQRSATQDEAIIKHLIDTEIAHTKDAVVDELRKLGATREQAQEAYDTCERTEQASPRSFWGAAQGLTRNSQQSGYQDDRLQLDQLAAAVLKRGALVTV